MRLHAPLLLVAALGLFASPAAGQYDRARAEANYIAVARGEKSLSALTAIELQDVAAVDREVRGAARTPRLSAEQRCRLAQLRENERPTRLQRELLDLRCARR